MAYSPYNDVQTNYRTSDGQFFRSESDAQAHMQEQADRERGMAAIGALNDALRKERMKLWESIHDKYYKPAQNFAKQGIIAFHDQKDWEKAIEAFTKALAIYTNNNLLEQYKQELLKCARQWNQEDNEAFSTHESLEEYTAYKYAMKSVKVWQEDMEECEGMLRASKVKIGITHESDNKADELRGQGFYFTEQKDYDKAISFFTLSLSFGDDHQTYLSRAVCYEKKGNIDQAIADVTSAINCYKGRKLKMTANSLYGNRARLYKAKGEIKKAEADLKEMENWNEKPYPPPPQSTSSSPKEKHNIFKQLFSGKRLSAEELQEQGDAADEKGDTAKAIELWTKAADMGNVTAQCNLAYTYLKGNGVPKDLAKTKEWYEKAAAQGHTEAINYLKELK